jgi:hypothetical protein
VSAMTVAMSEIRAAQARRLARRAFSRSCSSSVGLTWNGETPYSPSFARNSTRAIPARVAAAPDESRPSSNSFEGDPVTAAPASAMAAPASSSAAIVARTDPQDVAALTARFGRTAPARPILAVSAMTGDGMDAVAGLVRPGETVALVGMWGVGKSSLAGYEDVGGKGRGTDVGFRNLSGLWIDLGPPVRRLRVRRRDRDVRALDAVQARGRDRDPGPIPVAP